MRWSQRRLQPLIHVALERVARSTAIVMEYPAYPRARWGWGAPPHPELEALLAEHADGYRSLLASFEAHLPALRRIPSVLEDPSGGFWDNGFFGNLDGVGLYGFIGERRPARYMEIGSGFSTRMAHRAITDAGLETKLVSIDPSPRVEVDLMCDEVHRVRLEDAPLDLFDELQRGDVLLVDGTHMAHMNSDVTVLFMEVFPRLAAGVLVGIDDIFLPWDYPPEWAHRWFSEQYLLGVLLLSDDPRWRPVLPAWWVSQTPAFAAARAPFAAGLDTTAGMLGNAWWMERIVQE
jgi:hypothetical protein